MPNKVGYFRKELERHQTTARQLVLDEIEDEVKRLKEYVDSMDYDVDIPEDLQGKIQYIKESLEAIQEKLY
jgi:Skp family chaperone for outer membrane proteins